MIGVIGVGSDVIWINMIQNDRICAPNIFNFKMFLSSAFSKMLLSPRFSNSLFAAPCPEVILSDKSYVTFSNRKNLAIFLVGIPSPLFHLISIFRLILLPIYILVICGIMLPIVLDGFIGMTLFLFWSKSIFILSQLLQTPKEKFQSPCPRLSMEALAWLVWMSVLSEHALLIVSSSDPIVIADNP